MGATSAAAVLCLSLPLSTLLLFSGAFVVLLLADMHFIALVHLALRSAYHLEKLEHKT